MTKRTKHSLTYRGHTINLETTEEEGRWLCSARFRCRKGDMGKTAYSDSGAKGFPSKDQAEEATIRWVKTWIDDNLPESPPA